MKNSKIFFRAMTFGSALIMLLLTGCSRMIATPTSTPTPMPTHTPACKLICDISMKNYEEPLFKFSCESGQVTKNMNTIIKYDPAGPMHGSKVTVNQEQTYAQTKNTYKIVGNIVVNKLLNTVSYDITATGGAFGEKPQTCRSGDITGSAVQPTAAAVTEDKRLELVYLENSHPVPHRAIFVRYYDEATMKSVVRTAITEDNGMATLTIPGRGDGSSYVFQVVLLENQFSKAQAFRFASWKGGQPTLLIQIDPQIFGDFTKAAVQFMRYPADGETVGTGGDIATSHLKWSLIRK